MKTPEKLQPEQEHVAEVERKIVHGHMCVFITRTPSNRDIPDGTKLYAAPPELTKRIAGLEAQLSSLRENEAVMREALTYLTHPTTPHVAELEAFAKEEHKRLLNCV